MASSETGHSKNIANFETLVTNIQSFGGAYNPSRNNLKMPALTPLPSIARDSINEVNHFADSYSVAVNQRETSFEGLDKLVTRVMGALEISDASADAGERARTLARKLRGRRDGERFEDDPETPGVDESQQNNSVSQMSYDNQLANFEAFVGLLESQGTAYAPNETDLQADTLRTRATDMRAKNTAVTSAQTALESARISRNNVLYNDTTGLVAIAADIKKYVKSAFGADSTQYQRIKDLKFTTPR